MGNFISRGVKKATKWVKKQTHGGLSVKGLKSSVKGALKPHNLGYTLGALTLGAAALPGVSLGGMASGAMGGLKSVGGAIAGAGKGALGMVPGGLKSVGKFALDNKDLIVGGLGAVQGMKDDQRSRELMNQALAQQQERQRMAGAAADRIGTLQRPDLSHLYMDPANPYARRRLPSVGGY